MRKFLRAVALVCALSFIVAAPATAQVVAPLPVALQPGGSASQVFSNDAVTTVVQIKSTQGVILSLYAVNTTASTAYLQVFCKPSASVTLGTTAPDFFVRLPSTTVSATLNPGTANVALTFPNGACNAGVAGASGISIAGTTTPTGLTGAVVSVSATYL